MSEAYADPASSLPGRIDALLRLTKDLFDGIDPAPYLTRPEFAGSLIDRRLAAPSIDLTACVAALPRPACTC